MPRIYVIDDEAEVTRLISIALENKGYSVLRCENGRKAIEHLRYEAADLIILDILMPEMDGIETLRAARQLQPQLPVLAISGGGYGEPGHYLGLARSLGATAILRKPFQLPELTRLVSTLLGETAD